MDKDFLAFKEEVERELFQVWMPHAGQIEIIEAFLLNWCEGVFLQCGRKLGKALCLDTPILTPSGFKPIGEIQDGDTVFNEMGLPVKVLQSHDIIHDAESYRVHFCNGYYIDACKDHQWLTWTKADRKNSRRGHSHNPSVKSTLDIFNSQMNGKEYNHSIPYTKPVSFPEKNLEIDPYIFGCWLGDGATHGAKITNIDQEIDDYIYSSEDQRLALLQGLMDTDGYINNEGTIAEFYNTNKQIAESVRFLVASLGMKPLVKTKIGKLNGIEKKLCYIVRFKPTIPVFRLKRKLSKQSRLTKHAHHTIVKVEKIENKPMRCLTVSGESKLFLAGYDLIPTHNTDVAVALLLLFAMLFENAECYFVADEKDHARKIIWENGRLPRFFTSIKQQKGESYESFQERRRIGFMLDKKWIAGVNNQEMIVTLSNNSKIMVEGAKNYSKADGLSPVFVVYDEFKHHDERFDIAMRPNLRALNGRILIMGTPPDNVENYYCKIADEFRHKPKHIFLQKPSYMNPHVYSGPDDEGLAIEEAEYRRRGEWHIFAREYLAQIVPDENSMIFPMLRREIHVADYDQMKEEILRSIREWEFYVSFDPASMSVFGVLIVAINKYDKRIYLMDEIYESKTANTRSKLIFERARNLWREIDGYDGDWYKIYDHAASWFNVEVQAEFEESINPCVKDLNNKEAKISVIKDAMIYGRFLMSSRCIKTFWELQNYKKNDKGIVPKENDHNIDNLRYILEAAYYTSVPKDEIKPIESRRAFTMSDDINTNLLDGGIIYDHGY